MMIFKVICDEPNCDAVTPEEQSIVSLGNRMYVTGWDLLTVKNWSNDIVKDVHYCPEHAKY